MSKQDDGGPAFPVQESMVSGSTGEVPAASGMSLRDYFAAKAMQAIVTGSVTREGQQVYSRNVSRDAYGIADAMLEARK